MPTGTAKLTAIDMVICHQALSPMPSKPTHPRNSKSFEDGIDSLALGDCLTFEQRTIILDNNTASIPIASTGELLALLMGVKARLIEIEDFTFS